jgi:hypothetical protein
MAKKNTAPSSGSISAKSNGLAKPAAVAPAQPARGGTLEAKPSANAPKAATHDEIARAAFLRWQTHGGDPESNWLAAERELGVKH